ncbi:MAG: hypothetical protein K1W26_07850 [Acetatifactor sp.]
MGAENVFDESDSYNIAKNIYNKVNKTNVLINTEHIVAFIQKGRDFIEENIIYCSHNTFCDVIDRLRKRGKGKNGKIFFDRVSAGGGDRFALSGGMRRQWGLDSGGG